MALSLGRQAIKFELDTIEALQRQFKWTLQHTGQAGDHGIDFRTAFSDESQVYTIVGQCKYLTRTHVLPKDIRELEGVVARERMLDERVVGATVRDIIGVLAFHVAPTASKFIENDADVHDDIRRLKLATKWPISAASMKALRTSPLPLAACLMQSREGLLHCIKVHCNAAVPAHIRHFCETSVG